MDFLEDYSGDLTVSYTESESYSVSIAHIHPHGELLLKISNGITSFILNGKTFHMEGPCLAYYPPYIMHKTQSMGEYNRYVLYIGIEPRFISPEASSFITDVNSTPWILRVTTDFANECIRYLTEIATEPKDTEEKLLWYRILQKKIEGYLISKGILNEDRTQNPSEDLIFFQDSEVYIQKIVHYIIDHYQESITTEELAKLFLTNRDKLNRDFKAFTGTTIRQFMIEVRLNRAKALLRNGHSVSEVSDLTGFQNTSYFISSFVKAFGISPAKYAKRSYVGHL